MRDLNRIILIGRLGTDPVQRETKNGTPVTHFSLATARKTMDDNADQGGDAAETGEAAERTEGSENTQDAGFRKYNTETVWHNVVVWGRQAQSCAAYLKKGQTVYVEGSIRKRSYQAKDGQERISFEVHAESVGFLGGGRRGDAEKPQVIASAS